MNTETRFFSSLGLKKACSICGNPIDRVDRTKPSLYCSPHCANYAKFKSALEKEILSINPSPACCSVIRGDLFRLANLLSNRTKSPKDEK